MASWYQLCLLYLYWFVDKPANIFCAAAVLSLCGIQLCQYVYLQIIFPSRAIQLEGQGLWDFLCISISSQAGGQIATMDHCWNSTGELNIFRHIYRVSNNESHYSVYRLCGLVLVLVLVLVLGLILYSQHVPGTLSLERGTGTLQHDSIMDNGTCNEDPNMNLFTHGDDLGHIKDRSYWLCVFVGVLLL